MSEPIDITEVQAAAQAAIAAASYFAGKVVLLDNGKIQKQEEAAINDEAKGECVVVGPLEGADAVGQGSGAALVDVGIGVRYKVNPHISDTDPLEMMKKGTAALLAYSVTDKRNNFRLAGEFLTLWTEDPGLREYLAFYIKPAALRHTD